MTDSYIELYDNTATNDSAVAVNSSLYFGNEVSDREAKQRYNSSFTFFEISTSSNQKIEIKLDGITVLLRMNGSGAISLKPSQGRAFGYAEITNIGTADIDANDLNVRYGIAVRQDLVKPEKLKKLLSTAI